MTLVLALSGCGGSGNATSTPTPTPTPTTFTFDASEMITNLTNDIIVSGYIELNTQAVQLQEKVLNLMLAPTQANLIATQEGWKAARKPWEQGEAHIFGPIDALSIDPHLDSWPLNTNDLIAVLDNSAGFSADLVRLWNDDIQGFHTMEFLLFGDGVNDNVKDIEQFTAQELEYLVALSEVFAGYTLDLENAWIVSNNNGDAYKDTLISADNDFYSSQTAVIEELINGMIGIVDEVGAGKIADPFGASIDSVDTSKVESQYSWNSLTDFTDNIKGVLNVYQGEKEGQTDKQGLYDFVAAGDAALATRVQTEIETAIAAVEAIAGDNNMPFRQALSDADGRVRIEAAVAALLVLQTSLTDEVLPLLNDWDAS